MSRLKEIEDWIVYTGGVVQNADRNHFGGDPSATPPMNLMMQQRPPELAMAVELFLNAKDRGEKIDYYCEIGPCSGGTTRCMHHFLEFKELLLIDDAGEENPYFYIDTRENYKRLKNLGGIPRVEIIGNSQHSRVIETVKKMSEIHLYDILFIDGDHSYEGAKNDFEQYESILRPGGYLMFHDSEHIEHLKELCYEIDSMSNYNLIVQIAKSDPYTDAIQGGIGITILQKCE